MTTPQLPVQPQEPDPPQTDQSNKVIIVTGANVGIGYATAHFLAKLNPQKLILACRNMSKANEALNKIKADTGCTTIEAWELDLASFASTKAFAKRFLDTGLPLDTLVSNAAVGSFDPKWIETGDGFEITYQVNHISNALLVLLLTPALKKAKVPRIEIVSSGTYTLVKAPTPDDPTPLLTVLKKPNLLPERNPCYFTSKLFNILFTNEFARRCPYPSFWICSSTPGFADTELASKDPVTGDGYKGDTRPQVVQKRTPYEGAKTVLFCVLADPVPGPNGSFLRDSGVCQTGPTITGEVGARFAMNLWRDTMNILRKVVDNQNQIEDWAWA